jgi:predicted CXXCH cytochrome family protein
MNRLLLCLTLCLAAITLAPALSIADDSIHVLSPPDNSLVHDKLINLVIRIRRDSFDDLRVTVVNSNFRSQPEAVVMFIVRHHRLTLSEGKNLIRIEGLRGGHVMGEKLLTVFVRSPLSEQQETNPAGFNQYIFHTPKNEKTCSPSPCHMQELRQGAKSRQKQALPSCYTCHKRIVAYDYVHGPASVWACTICHTQNSEKGRNAVPHPIADVCRMCHTLELAAWQSEKFGHRPTRDGKCILCHSPHASNEPFFLVKGASDLCGSCHPDKMTEPHVIIRPSGKGHPVKQQSGKGRKRGISCASCHNPHAANNARLLKKFKGSQISFCRNCHH